MHYQHRYHAGNFADVFKHVLLIGLLDALNAKPAPWAFLDTHAGAGRYRWDDEALARTGEVEGGARRVLAAEGLTGWLARYASRVRDDPFMLPGSPAIADTMRRQDDRLMLCENAPAVVETLRAEMRGPGIAVHQRDGYGAWALLPPAEKRGLVLVDPAFEARDELDQMLTFAKQAVGRFAHGIYAFWYPVKSQHSVDRFARRLAQQVGRDVLDARLHIEAPRDGRMCGCGLAILNPPWAFAQALPDALRALQAVLGQDRGAAHHIEHHTP
ncbi:MAG: 23S rRNA (adenine(2030)-N(6))-methyltransferase RlmJ [Polycyclovorans sp.]